MSVKARKRKAAQRAAHNAGRDAVLGPELREALDAARNDRDKKLGKLATDYQRRVKELLEEWRVERVKVWKEHDERRTVLVRHHRPEATDG